MSYSEKPTNDKNQMKDFSQLKKNIKKDFSKLNTIKIAVLGDTATQFLTIALRGLGFDYGYNFDIWEADYNQIERQVFDLNSDLHVFKPDFVIVFKSSHKLLGKYNKTNPEQYLSFGSNELKALENIYTFLFEKLNTKVIFYNFNEIDDAVFGSFSNKIESSFLFQLRKLNYELMTISSKYQNLFLCDLSSIQNSVGKANVFQPSVYVNSDMVLSIDVLPKVATKTLDIISAIYGKFRKCIILDLDNTIWGGTIGDDGIENIQIGNLGIGKAFTEFQYWIKKLINRGVIVAVCSKNTKSIAIEPFEKHPDMVLQLKDIAVFVANWENKVDNIKYIQSVLNIGFDTMVFLDDNPFERNMVREMLPDICVPELPDDPAEYLEFLYQSNLFETASFSAVDLQRTALYQVEAQRATFQDCFTNEDDFLKSLNMVSIVSSFNKFNVPRIAQLSQRSNQFNLRTVRYTETDILQLISSKSHFTITFTLEDKFGDNGLVCVIILKKENADVLFIDTWLMSCRVLKRGMENFVLNSIAQIANENGFSTLKGQYLPTLKNEMVKDHYLHLGFRESNEFWNLNVKNYQNRLNYITYKQ
jgi:FkbH-like protein